MCGVFGILGYTGTPEEAKQQAKRSLAQIGHRGPDAWGTYADRTAVLGHVRLSIVDLKSGHQPMYSDNVVLSFNGEIYNHIELRQELEAQGHSFTTRSDTEVILKAYLAYGTGCFERFNGEWSLLIWDKREQRLIVSRDRYGIRPLYCLNHNGSFYFSSEMKAFDEIEGFRREINPQHLFEHALLWNTLGDDCLYKDIRSVESGTYEVFAADGFHSTGRYYQIGETLSYRSETCGSMEESVEEFRELLASSVDLRLRSDVPVGAYLSGGIDSTVVAQIVKQQTGHEFSTFSVAFDDDSLDESSYQDLVSEQVNSVHHKVTVSYDDVAENISEAVRHSERPVFRTAPVPLFMLSGEVERAGLKVVLTGEGADEILFGYDTFKELKILEAWKQHNDTAHVDAALKQLYPHLAHYADPKQFGLMKMYYEGFLDSFGNDFAGLNIRMNNNKIIKNYLNKDWGIGFDQDALQTKLGRMLPDSYRDWGLLQRNSFLEIKTLMQGYLLSSQGDRMAMSHGIEGRFPFLDHRLVEFAFALPDHYKLNDFNQKFILKEAYKNEIPEQVLNRPKRPYMAPDLVAFVGPDGRLGDIAAEMLSREKIEQFGIFDSAMVERFLRKFSKGVPDHIGYRDNMIFIFMLTSQLCQYWLGQRSSRTLDPSRCMADITG